MTGKGKVVRADFELVRRDASARTLMWSQRLAGSPFERLLRRAETELQLAPAASPEAPDEAAAAEAPAPAAGAGAGERATEVTIELRQDLAGILPRFGSFMVRRAALATVEEALDGLERISG